jgi:hypothetical protein
MSGSAARGPAEHPGAAADAAGTVVLPALPGRPPAAVPTASGERPTTALDPSVAAAQADPGALTQVLARPAAPPVGGTATAGPRPLLSRRTAAEVGVYAGAGLVLVALGTVAARGWEGWDTALRIATVALTSVGLVAAGLFIRLPWTRRAGDERRRAVSAMLTAGTGLGVVAAGVALDIGQAAPTGPAVAHVAAAVIGMAAVAGIARSPVSETALLVALGWATWVLVPAGPWTWAGLVGLGALWALLGVRYARGRRTAAVAGSGLALVASVGLAQGAWALPVSVVLAGLVVAGLAAFLRGWANHWLALGAGSATALAASVAGARLGPALALLLGGLATMAVSGIALRSARRAG